MKCLPTGCRHEIPALVLADRRGPRPAPLRQSAVPAAVGAAPMNYQKVYGIGHVYLGVMWQEPDGRWVAESRSVRVWRFEDYTAARSWLGAQVVRL